MVMSSNIAWKKAHVIFVFNATATSEIYTLSLHDALPIYQRAQLLAALPAQPFGKDPDMGIVADIVRAAAVADNVVVRSEEHTSELQSQSNLVCRLLLEKKNRGWYYEIW